MATTSGFERGGGGATSTAERALDREREQQGVGPEAVAITMATKSR